MQTTLPAVPWYREFYVWMVIAIPLSSVLVCMVLLTAAIRSDDGVVVDDYYKQGMAINLVLARDERAALLGLSAEVSHDAASGTLRVELASTTAATLPATLALALLHPTRAGSDHHIVIDRVPDGSYFGVVPELARGDYQLEIEGPDWRITQRLNHQ
jgi:uncharacterized protein